jgi:predicted RNase H-like HicB family nuclease
MVKSRETLMKEAKVYNIQVFWDTEAKVWVATSEDVSGLATEADTLENLNDKLREIIPELLILNGALEEDDQGLIQIELICHRQEIISLAS